MSSNPAGIGHLLQTYTFPRGQLPSEHAESLPIPLLNVLGTDIISHANGQSPTELINHITVTFPAQRSKAARTHNPPLCCIFVRFEGRMDPRAKEQLQLILKEASKVKLLGWSYQPKKAGGELAVSITNPSHSFFTCHNQVVLRTRLWGRHRNGSSGWNVQLALNTFILTHCYIRCPALHLHSVPKGHWNDFLSYSDSYYHRGPHKNCWASEFVSTTSYHLFYTFPFKALFPSAFEFGFKSFCDMVWGLVTTFMTQYCMVHTVAPGPSPSTSDKYWDVWKTLTFYHVFRSISYSRLNCTFTAFTWINSAMLI